MNKLQDCLDNLDKLKEQIGSTLCDKFEGDCTKCPFSNDCICYTLDTIWGDIVCVRIKLKEILG